jgi:hypothetical protein
MFRRGLLLLLPILVTFTIVVNSRAASSLQPTVFPILVTVQSSANLRAGPGTDFAITGGAKSGQVFYALGCNDDCSWVQLGPDCWIAAFLVAPYLPVAPVIPTVNVAIPITITATLTDTFLIVLDESTPSPLDAVGLITQCPQTREETNTYAGPSTFYPVVDTRPAGECVAVVGRNRLGDWFQLSHGMWLPATVVIYAEPIIYMPITEPTATPTPTPLPTSTPLPGSQPPTPTPQLSTTSAQGCDPNYSGACVPLSTVDLDCPQIPATDFSSTGNDPHDLDGDKDGIACEDP